MQTVIWNNFTCLKKASMRYSCETLTAILFFLNIYSFGLSRRKRKKRISSKKKNIVLLLSFFFLTRQKARDILPACFCDDHLCPNVMKSFPEVSALQLYLDLFHGRRRRRLRAWATRCKVRMGAKRAGRPFCQHLCVRPSALLWVCKVNTPGKTLKFYLRWDVKGEKREACKGSAKEQYNGLLYRYIQTNMYLWFVVIYGLIWVSNMTSLSF